MSGLVHRCRAEESSIVDNVRFESSSSRTSHRVIGTNCTYVQNAVILGTTLTPISGARIVQGGNVTARLSTPELKPLSLLITISTNPANVGKKQIFHVKIDGKKALIVSDSDPGGGTARSFFLPLIPTTRSTSIEIIVDKQSAIPIIVSSLRLYSGLGNALPGSRNARMEVAVVSPKEDGFGLDKDILRSISSDIPLSPYIAGQAAVLYNFSIRTAQENNAEINRLVSLSEAANVPLRFAFQFHKGGLPKGVPDGAGNTFLDLPYQQVTFDTDNTVEDANLKSLMGDHYDKRYGLTIPNHNSNLPSLTFNHPRLNQLRKIRFTQTLTAWREARERLIQDGKAGLLPPDLSTGDETIYWAQGVDDRGYTKINGKPRENLMADFNPFVVADALKEGVNLDPRDGLNLQERNWLHLNLARQQQRIVDWMFDTLPPTPIRIIDKKPLFVNDIPRRNLFTEPYAMPLFPLNALGTGHPGLELGYVVNGRSGGKYSSAAMMLPWLLKERERGRIALPNLECSGINDAQLLATIRAAYACGARYVTLYNSKDRPVKRILTEFAKSIEKPEGVQWPPAAEITSNAPDINRKYSRDFQPNVESFGANSIILYPRVGSEIVPITVAIRDEDPGSTNFMSVTATPNLQKDGTWRLLLPTLYAVSPEKHYRISIASVDLTPLSLLVAKDGSFASQIVADIANERSRSWAIEEWQDTVDLLDSLHFIHAGAVQSFFARDALQEAETLFAKNQPAQAYIAGIRAEQLSLPASYLLPAGTNRMTPYYFNITAPLAPVRARIITYSPEIATVTVQSAVDQKVTLNWGKMTTSANLTANIPVEVTLERLKNIVVKRISPEIRRPVRRRPNIKLPTSVVPSKLMGPPTPVFGPPTPNHK